MKKEWKKRIGMALAVAGTLLAGLLLFYRHWRFALPLYPNVDEELSLNCIYQLLDQHLYAGDIYVLNFFRYPHLTFYYAAAGVRLLGRFLKGVEQVILIRYVVCGTALLSNVFVYFSVKIMTKSRKWAYLGFLLSLFSLYGYSYLYYTGPDTMMYAVANVILLLGCTLFREQNEERAVYLWYPLLAVSIGLSMAAKYHGVVFGLFWLALHIGKGYWKRHRNNYLFFLDCILLVLTFALCNYSLFFHFQTFIGDNLYNLNHYAWGHPGIERALPLFGYLEAYSLTSYGAFGGLLLLLGALRLCRGKEWRQLFTFSLMPLCTVLLLSKYQIVLGRNLSLALPFAFLFMTYGLMEAEALFAGGLKRWQAMASGKGSAGRAAVEGKGQTVALAAAGKKSAGWAAAGGKGRSGETGEAWRAAVASAAVGALTVLAVLRNGAAVLGDERYALSYDRALSYIEANVPPGARLYCTDYMPALDTEKYDIVGIGEDVSLLPEWLSEQEYFVDVEYATGYFFQKKDGIFAKGADMYPEKRAAYEEKTGGYRLLQDFPGTSYGGEWKYRVGYLDQLFYDPAVYSKGPGIKIYH